MTLNTVDRDVFRIKQNDLSPLISEYLLEDVDNPVTCGSAMNLAGCTVRFHLCELDGTIVIDADAEIVSASGGLVRYEWVPGDTAQVGQFEREWEVTLPSLKPVTVPNDRRGLRIIIATEIA